MEENLDLEYTTTTKERPTFISVLCILSWIYVGIAVLGGMSSAFSSPEKLEEQLELSRAQIEDSPMASSDFMQDSLKFMESSVEYSKTMNLITLVLILIEGFAVFMMFKLNKAGFWIYTLVQIVIIGITVYFVPWPNFLSTLTVGFYVLLSGLFVILYGVNVKHMN